MNKWSVRRHDVKSKKEIKFFKKLKNLRIAWQDAYRIHEFWKILCYI